MLKSPFTKRETVVNFVTVRQKSLWTGGRAAEGTGLLNRRTGYTGTAGSNPALSVKKPTRGSGWVFSCFGVILQYPCTNEQATNNGVYWHNYLWPNVTRSGR